MNEAYIQMSKKLDAKLISLKNDYEDIFFVIEKAIGICTIVLLEMKDAVIRKDFPDKETEIHFFKYVKPGVYSRLIFYVKLLRIETRKPSTTCELQLRYLEAVLCRLQKCYIDNGDIYQYYRLKQTFLDDKYFLRNSDFTRINADNIHHLIDRKFSTAHDYTFALLMAHEQLIEYIGDAIQKLTSFCKGELKSDCTVSQSSKLHWTESKAAMVELIYALHSSESINEGKLDIKEITEVFERMFNIQLGDVYHTFLEVRNRKIERTKFIDHLKKSLIKRMDKADEK